MRLLHTSDWHLGHTLKEVTREHEHAAFLAWLLDACVREAPDVVVITGDVFDTATPPASAERMWFEFLAAARRARPHMDIIAIAGNHDSPARLGAASSVLRELGVHVIGGLPRVHRALAEGSGPVHAAGGSATTESASDGLVTAAVREGSGPIGSIDLDRVLIPVASGQGLVAAVPFLRPVDVPADVDDPLAAVYGEVLVGARRVRRADQALIVLGHLYVTGAEPSYLSERRVSIGGQESASLRLFPSDIDYVALGHMHRAQRVGRATIRYAGAPLALSLDEAGYRHQVIVVDFAGGRVTQMRSLAVPQTIEIVRIPTRGAAPLAEVLDAIARLPPRAASSEPDPTRPYLEIAVELERPEPRLRTTIEAALDGKRPRLVQLRAELDGSGAALADRVVAKRLAELDPRDVFAQLWARDHAEPPGADVVAAFDRLLAEVRGDLDDPEREREAS